LRPREILSKHRRHAAIKSAVKIVILIVWALMMASLISRELLKREPPAVDTQKIKEAKALPARELWFGVYIRGEKIGYLRSSRERAPHGYLFIQEAFLRFTVMGLNRSVRSKAIIKTDELTRPISFRAWLRSGAVRLQINGRVRGETCHVEIRSAAGRQYKTLTIPNGTLMNPTMRLFLNHEGIDPGRAYTVNVFDPLSMRIRPLEIRIEKKGRFPLREGEITAYRVLYSWGDLKVRGWVDAFGDPIMEENPSGWTIVREGKREAMRRAERSPGGPDLWNEAAIPTKGSIESPRESRLLRIRLEGIDLGALPLDTERQKAEDTNVLRILSEDLSEVPPELNPPCGKAEPVDGLESTPWIQSRDPRIKALSQRIVRGQESCLNRARSIMQWVFENLAKEPLISIPNALEVLELKKGDCNEHAVLFAALARAAGIPARLCAGVIYEDGKLMYHAWNEVYVGKWLCVDPTLGQFPCDAAHIKFVQGNVDDLFNMGALMGDIRAEVLEVR
jgi:transglutaminase-like putative cysteine protease